MLVCRAATTKVPIEGFKGLQPNPFKIQRGNNRDGLPTAHTYAFCTLLGQLITPLTVLNWNSYRCFNQIDLPDYTSVKMLKQQLLTAIREGNQYFAFS